MSNPATIQKADSPLLRLKERRDFLRVAGTRRRWVTPAFIIQAAPGQDRETKIGFTVSKKVGNAVERNRMRRRLREMARLTMRPLTEQGWHYVLVGRAGQIEYPFEQLEKDLKWGLKKLHQGADLKSRDKRTTSKPRLSTNQTGHNA